MSVDSKQIDRYLRNGSNFVIVFMFFKNKTHI